jgi:hypothetical protein
MPLLVALRVPQMLLLIGRQCSQSMHPVCSLGTPPGNTGSRRLYLRSGMAAWGAAAANWNHPLQLLAALAWRSSWWLCPSLSHLCSRPPRQLLTHRLHPPSSLPDRCNLLQGAATPSPPAAFSNRGCAAPHTPPHPAAPW